MTKKSTLDFAQEILDNYRRFNIDDVEVLISENKRLSVKSRNLKLENIDRSNSININVNIYKDNRKASLSLNNIKKIKINEFLEKGSAMVSSMPIDKFCGLPDKKDYETSFKDLDLEDKNELSDKEMLQHAISTEAAMLENKKITNSEGATRGASKNTSHLITSKGFKSSFTKTYHSISTIAIAGTETNMQRDYEYSSAIYSKDLSSFKEIGEKAANRAVSRLSSKKIKSCSLDVIFEPRVAKSILSSFCSCANGVAIARKTSFLENKINNPIFKENIKVTNNPKILRGLGSMPYDDNGIKSNKINIIDKGVLKNFFLNLRSSRQLNIPVNGNSGPRNLILENGSETLENIISSIKNGFLITEMLGMSFNPVNGDYSRGAAGFKIDNGEISYPVSEVTIAGNMLEMMMNLTPANDMEINDNINCPSILINDMTLAGL